MINVSLKLNTLWREFESNAFIVKNCGFRNNFYLFYLNAGDSVTNRNVVC